MREAVSISLLPFIKMQISKQKKPALSSFVSFSLVIVLLFLLWNGPLENLAHHFVKQLVVGSKEFRQPLHSCLGHGWLDSALGLSQTLFPGARPRPVAPDVSGAVEALGVVEEKVVSRHDRVEA